MISTTLIRIIGNNLPPRHDKDQNVRNLRYILENECPFEKCKKVFLLNRIVDDKNREKLIETLEEFSADYVEIEINEENYLNQNSFYEKFSYLTNNNGARNLAVDLGFSYWSDLVLPLDGNCFFRADGWDTLINSCLPVGGYVVIMMVRGKDIKEIENSEVPSWFEVYRFGNKEIMSATEPQIGFFKDYDKKFDVKYPYSKAPKVNLLWKLGVPGIWDRWYPHDRSMALNDKSKFFGEVRQAGWVYRLPSGVNLAEEDNAERGNLRDLGLMRLVEYADQKYRS